MATPQNMKLKRLMYGYFSILNLIPYMSGFTQLRMSQNLSKL